jgi:hypothetical protein
MSEVDKTKRRIYRDSLYYANISSPAAALAFLKLMIDWITASDAAGLFPKTTKEVSDDG